MEAGGRVVGHGQRVLQPWVVNPRKRPASETTMQRVGGGVAACRRRSGTVVLVRLAPLFSAVPRASKANVN